MTTIQLGKSLTRKTHTVVQGRELVVTLHPGFMAIRQAKTRTAFEISYNEIYKHAAQMKADRIRAEKKAAKKGHGH